MKIADIKLIIGGRSMGGRIASHVAAQGAAVDAVALFAYPLHPPGTLSKRGTVTCRKSRLRRFSAPAPETPFATPEELAAAAATVPRATVHPLEGADHGFAVLKSSGRTKEDVWSEATAFLLSWLETEVLDSGGAAHLR